MKQNILNDIKLLVQNIPASDYDTSYVLSQSKYKEQIVEAIYAYIKTVGQNIERDVKIKGIIRASSEKKTTLPTDFTFNIGERKIAIKIDNGVKHTTRDLLTHLMNREHSCLISTPH